MKLSGYRRGCSTSGLFRTGLAHDDTAIEREGIEAQGEAPAVAGPYICSAGGFAFAGDAIQAELRAVGVRIAHGLAPWFWPPDDPVGLMGRSATRPIELAIKC